VTLFSYLNGVLIV